MGTCLLDKVFMGNFVTRCPRLDSIEEQINSRKLPEGGTISFKIPDVLARNCVNVTDCSNVLVSRNWVESEVFRG